MRKTAAIALATFLVPAGSAHADATTDARAVTAGLVRAVAAGRLTQPEADRHYLTLRRARVRLALIPRARRAHLAGVLHDVAVLAPYFNRPRAQALFGMLDLNTRYLASRGMPRGRVDTRDADGVVYRSGWSRGFHFHPLANFAALNAHIRLQRDAEGKRHAGALAARAVPRGVGVVWEYYFRYGARPPWTSGMAQAVAAQAFARSGVRYQDPRFLQTARLAWLSIHPRLVIRLTAGPWIRHYSFSGMIVLNSHLQSVISLANYAALTGDTAAAAYNDGFKLTAQRLLRRFDTGSWSLYALGGREASLHYHLYVVDLLKQLAARTGEPIWANYAARFERYARQPPSLRVVRAAATISGRPGDGLATTAQVTFSLSKVSTVTLAVGDAQRALQYPRGTHTIALRSPELPAGVVSATLTAVDPAGNGASTTVPAIQVTAGPPDSPG